MLLGGAGVGHEYEGRVCGVVGEKMGRTSGVFLWELDGRDSTAPSLEGKRPNGGRPPSTSGPCGGVF